jgi:hypothetical protein
VAGFGPPLEIEVELATVPADIAYLAERGQERKRGYWRVRVPDGTDPDALVHELIEKTLAAGGRIRKIGVAEPDPDELFSEYIARHRG